VDSFGLHDGRVRRHWPNAQASTAVFCVRR